MTRVYEGIGGWWVSRSPFPGDAVSGVMHPTREAAEQEAAEIRERENEAVYDFAVKLSRFLREARQ